MSYTSKDCIVSWWIVVIVCFILWYRNAKYDRLFAVILFVASFYQLVNYGCHNAMNSKVAGNLVIIISYLLLFVITVGVYIQTRSGMSAVISIISMLFLIYIIVDIIGSKNKYKAYISKSNGVPVWENNGGGMLGNNVYLYLIFILVSWIILMHYNTYNNITLYIIGIYIFLSLIYSAINYNQFQMGPYWTYILVGIVLIVWFDGIF